MPVVIDRVEVEAAEPPERPAEPAPVRRPPLPRVADLLALMRREESRVMRLKAD